MVLNDPSVEEETDLSITPDEAVELLKETSEALIKAFYQYGIDCAIILVNPEEGDASFFGIKSEWMQHAIESTAKQLKDEVAKDNENKVLH